MSLNKYENLVVWQKGYKLVLEIYQLTINFPKEEIFGITNQLRRSASSICANIVEGYKRGDKEFIRYLNIARGSLEETHHHLRLSKDLGYCTEEKYNELINLIDEIGKMLYSLKQKLILKTVG